MVELICVVAAHVYIEQCIDMLNVFKVNYKGHRMTFFEISLVFFVNLIMFVTLVWFSVARQRKFFSLISWRSKKPSAEMFLIQLKTALEKFIGMITHVSNIFLSINNSDIIIAPMIKVLYRIQQRLTSFNNGVF